MVPRQLPPAARHFAGRAAEVDALDALLDQTGGGTVVISAIDGTAGIGKTTLAVHWAHRVADRFPDGQLYANLRGFDPGGTPLCAGDVVRGFLDALEVPPQRVPADLDGQAALYRSVVSGRRILVLLDNARDAGQVRPLLPGTPSCLAVVTSRNRLTSLITAEGAHPVTLDLLSTAESRDLLAARLGPRSTTDPRAVDEVIALSARLPLALSIVAARAATHPTFPLADLAGELRAARGGLDAFDGGDPATDSRAVFSWSYRTLAPAAARLFRLFGLHPGADLSGPAAASLAGVPAAQARPLLGELTRTHLLSEPAPGRYTTHDLLRVYAAERATDEEPDTGRAAATGRLLDHYLHAAHGASRLLAPHREVLPLDPRAGVSVEEFTGNDGALAWFTAEHANLRAVLRYAADGGLDRYVWQLAWALTDFLDFRGYWSEWLDMQHLVLDAARRMADPATLAHAHRGLGRAHIRLGRFDEAHTHLEQALAAHESMGDDAGVAFVHNSLLVLMCRQDRYPQALVHAERALHHYQAAKIPAGQATALNAVGWIHAQLGDHRAGLDHCRRALALFEDLDDRYGQASTWDSLGFAHHHLGDHAQAIGCLERASELYAGIGNRYYHANALFHLGDSRLAAGDRAGARADWQRALDILDELGHPEAERVRERLLAS